MIWSNTLHASIDSGSRTWSTISTIWRISWHIKFVNESVFTSVEPVPGAGVVAGAVGTLGQAATEVIELLTWPPSFFSFEGFVNSWQIQVSAKWLRSSLSEEFQKTNPELPIGYDLGTSYVVLQNQTAIYSMLDFQQIQLDTKRCGSKHPMRIQYLEPYFLDRQVIKIQRLRIGSRSLFGNSFGNFQWFSYLPAEPKIFEFSWLKTFLKELLIVEPAGMEIQPSPFLLSLTIGLWGAAKSALKAPANFICGPWLPLEHAKAVLKRMHFGFSGPKSRSNS